VITITNKGIENIKVPFAEPDTETDAFMYVIIYDGESKNVIDTIQPDDDENCTEEDIESTVYRVLKPNDVITFRYELPDNYLGKNIYLVAASSDLSRAWLTQLAVRDTNPFTRTFWQKLWSDRGVVTFDKFKITSNAVQFGNATEELQGEDVHN
jgi:hypothetical protein